MEYIFYKCFNNNKDVKSSIDIIFFDKIVRRNFYNFEADVSFQNYKMQSDTSPQMSGLICSK